MSGKVWLVGAGPGAVDLLTVRALRLIEQADVLFHDALVEPEVVALARRARCVAVGKRCGRHSTAQRFINQRLVQAAREHGCVVRLKGGDPMLFGRAQEEIDALLAAGVEVEVVPGVTAALAASADLRQSLTQRGRSRSVAFVTPRVGEGEAAGTWAQAALAADTAVIYMGAREAASIAATLVAGGRSPATPVALVESASLPGNRVQVATLAGLTDAAASMGEGPILLLVGEVYAALPAALAVQAGRRSTPTVPLALRERERAAA